MFNCIQLSEIQKILKLARDTYGWEPTAVAETPSGAVVSGFAAIEEDILVLRSEAHGAEAEFYFIPASYFQYAEIDKNDDEKESELEKVESPERAMVDFPDRDTCHRMFNVAKKFVRQIFACAVTPAGYRIEGEVHDVKQDICVLFRNNAHLFVSLSSVECLYGTGSILRR